jgi:hypothetical protein
MPAEAISDEKGLPAEAIEKKMQRKRELRRVRRTSAADSSTRRALVFAVLTCLGFGRGSERRGLRVASDEEIDKGHGRLEGGSGDEER